jgi:hypothetical protein
MRVGASTDHKVGNMGLIRKITSVSSFGVVDFKSDKERIATYTKQTRNELRKLNQQPVQPKESIDTPWAPGQRLMNASEAVTELALLVSQRKYAEYKGYGAVVTLGESALTISRKGAMTRLQKLPEGKRQIEFNHVRGVVNKEPNLATNGSIFIYAITSSGPENLVLFTNQHRKEYSELLQILRVVAEVNYWTLIEQGQDADAVVQSEQNVESDVSSRLEMLGNLLGKGLISDEEFQVKRSEILNGI